MTRLELPPIYVDLDGTLSASDVLVESCLLLLRRNVLYGFLMVIWAFRGGWYFKQQIAKRINPDLSALPIREELVQQLQAYKAKGHRIVLASASLKRDVDKVAQRLGFFDAVLASENSNLKSENKRAAILKDCHGEPYVYFGDSSADLAVWGGAAQSWAVNPSALLRWRAARMGIELQLLRSHARPIRGLIKAMRLQQWAKNALLFVPLLAAHNHNSELWADMIWGFLAFGLVASATYIWNDLMDLNADRHHPRKCKRPMASGQVSIGAAFLWMKVVGLAGLLVSWLMVGTAFTVVLAIYTGTTLLYTFVFKRTAFVDVLMLAMLYTLRLIAGAVGTGIVLSSWLLAISMFLFLSLALVKRCAELEFLQFEGVDDGPKGRGYRMSDLPYLVSMGVSSGFVAVVVLALYVDSQNGSRLYANPYYLWGICPLLLFWLMRIWILTGRREMIDDPVHFAIYDKTSWAFVLSSAVLARLAA